MHDAVNREQLGIEASQNRRRESRIALAIPIEVTGFDATGKFFIENTKTADISESGCGFALRHNLERGGIVAIKALTKDNQQHRRRPLLYQVARSTPEGGYWIIGAAKLQSESIWLLAFPKQASIPAL